MLLECIYVMTKLASAFKALIVYVSVHTLVNRSNCTQVSECSLYLCA